MLTTRKLRPQIFRNSLIIVAAITTLTGCDYFSDNWEIESGKCQALSSGENEIAIVSEGSVGFLKMEKGCPDNLDILGSRFTDIEINGNPYKATLLCSDATGNRRVTMLGTSENSASTLSAQAMREFTGFMGAKVTIEGESSRFYKGNFTKICQRFLPRQTASAPSPSSDNSSLTLGDLLSGGRKNEPAPEPAPDPQAQMMAQAGYEKIDGEWRKKSRHPLAVTEQDRAATERIQSQTHHQYQGNGNDMPVSAYGHNTGEKSTPGTESSDTPAPTPPVPENPQPSVSHTDAPATVVADCKLTNGKALSVLAQDGFPYTYNLFKKDGTQELELKEGMSGVKAFHYYRELNRGKGELKYLRFNKGKYDYVVVQRYDGETPAFDGIIVFNNGTKIATLACKGAFNNLFSVEQLPKNSHEDSEEMADFIIGYTVRD
ncbi:hypothetical protein OGY34_14700 [Citrobacter sp. Cy232]|uniref:hypothetical protein n=1 Tax=Citrobacter sp. Cy232 TaxID=2985164 RepID=UPI002578DF7E|nr:hypothetical protein [Citrobacter sp. Cy232]MDM2717701.1 hypothetical protein [Citrobacter sp. Cy232]